MAVDVLHRQTQFPSMARTQSRRLAVRHFKLSLLLPLIALFAFLLMPVLLLQLSIPFPPVDGVPQFVVGSGFRWPRPVPEVLTD